MLFKKKQLPIFKTLIKNFVFVAVENTGVVIRQILFRSFETNIRGFEPFDIIFVNQLLFFFVLFCFLLFYLFLFCIFLLFFSDAGVIIQ